MLSGHRDRSGLNRSMTDVLSPILSVEQTAATLVSEMKKGLSCRHIVSPMAHHHYCLSKGKSEPMHHTKKKKEKKVLTSYSLSNARASFTASVINGKNCIGSSRNRICC